MEKEEPVDRSEEESPDGVDPGAPEMEPIGETDPGEPEMDLVPFSERDQGKSLSEIEQSDD